MKSAGGAVNAGLAADAAAGWLGPARSFLLFALVFGLLASISVTQIALGALAVWVVLARRAGVIPALRIPLLGPIVAFVVWTAVAALASERPLDSLLTARNALNLAALFVVVNVLSEPALVRRFATWLLAGLGLLALVALVQVAACPGPEATGLLRKCTRARGFYSIYMTLGGVLAVLLTSALPRLLRLQRDMAWLAPAWLFGLGALALTYVRGAWIGFAAGALAALAGLGRRGLVGLLALLVLGVALLVGLPRVRDRLTTIGTMSDDTTRDRMAMLEAGQRLVRERPLTGVGPGQIKHVYPKIATPEAMRRSTSHLHNSPLQIAAERGVPGLAAWLWIFVAFLLRGGAALRALPAHAAGDRALALGALAAVVAFLVAGLFEYNFGDTEVLLLTLTLMAWPFALGRTVPA
jgi:O-antigen ligase